MTQTSPASFGYVYCMSNESMPGLVKVGIVGEGRTPLDRARELFGTGVPTPFVVEFAKRVQSPREKETEIHDILTELTERAYPRREFFRTSSDVVRKLFNLMSGTWWDVPSTDKEETRDDEKDDEEEKVPPTRGCRDMAKCFTHGQRIRHVIGITKIWEGTYDAVKNGILYDGNVLTLYKFVSNHYKAERPDRTSEANAWKECQCEVNEKWISTYCLSG